MFGPAAQRLIARLEAAPPVHAAQVPGAPRGDDCLYRGEVVEDVRVAIPAIEGDGDGAPGAAAALARALADARETLVAASAGDALAIRLRPSVLRRHIAEIDGLLADTRAGGAAHDAAVGDAEFERVMRALPGALRGWSEEAAEGAGLLPPLDAEGAAASVRARLRPDGGLA